MIDTEFIEEYENNYREFNRLDAFGKLLTDKGRSLKKEASSFITQNLSRYMKLTNSKL